MKRKSTRRILLSLLSFAHLGCASDVVLPYVDDTFASAADSGGRKPPAEEDDNRDETDASVPTADTGPRMGPASADCDLTGRWLVAQRTVATAIGQQQAAHNWFYYEIEQEGETVTVTKGLHCGYEVMKIGVLAVNVDSHTSWPAFLERNSSTGRRGQYRLSGASCAFDLEKEYVARAVTLPHYLDPSNPLPARDDPAATGTTPGWEDWDGDGKAGVTLSVSGGANGQIGVVQRDWTQYSGAVPKGSTNWKVAVRWGNEQHALWSTSRVLEASSSPDSDPSLHYVYFAKLAADQATGTAAEQCEAVRSLAELLTPDANR